ncbi:PG0541 family transporter-associated protein [Sediminispirochaeta bajacaliforniensis]|uniref:PG0541 family transporter-associated protein n=1 Tax=Sediminispirochaeta bajacaliforniensis TaxID=148 RepID=UPI0003813ACF|nr:PG0541 family transporter-associated protein [Sediminispirochaeta bajacaliforniensis]
MKLLRVEIIANRSIEEDMHDAFRKAGIVRHYTKFPVVHGVGTSGPRRGDHVWPEENFVLTTYCEEEELDAIVTLVRELKEFFHDEGIKVFVSKAKEVL